MSLGFGFGMPRRVFAAPFTPQSLFSTGAQGAWYDPSDINLNWRYNLLTYTEQFDNAAWSRAGIVAFGSGSIANAITAPDGTLTADFIVEDTSTGQHIIYNTTNLAVPANVAHTISGKAKIGTRSYVCLQVNAVGASSGASVVFNLSNGTATQINASADYSVSNVVISPDSNGFYSFAFTFIGTGVTLSACWCLSNSATPALTGNKRPTYTGDGTSGIYIWGAQLQTGSVATTYQQIVTPEISYLTYQPQPVLYQDAAGTTPVTAVEQPVGLMLDKSKGLVLGSELVVNGDFSNGSTGWVLTSSATVVASSLSVTTTVSELFARQLYAIQTGKRYKVTFDCTATSGSVAVYVGRVSGAELGGVFTTSGTKTVYVNVATSDGYSCIFQSGASGFTGSIDNISVKELPGNHAFQTTAASRPVLSARYNLFVPTEDWTSSNWIKNNVTLTGSTVGTMTPTAVFGQHQTTNNAGTVVGPVSMTIEVKPNGYSKVAWKESATSGVYAAFNLSGAGTVIASTSGTPVITLLSDGYYRITMPVTATGNIGRTFIICADAYSGGDPNGSTFAGDGVSGVLLRYPQLVPSNQSTLPYQRVNTSTDYDTVGFKPYLLADGVDDGMVTNSINFTATDKMTVCAGVRKLSDAGGYGTVVESNTGTNSFGLFAPGSVASTYLFTSRGASNGEAQTATSYAAPITNVLTGIGNISGDVATLRVNGTQAATSTADQGTGNYGNYPLYLFRRGGTTLPFNGRMYEMTIVGKTVTAGELVNLETYTNQKTGAY